MLPRSQTLPGTSTQGEGLPHKEHEDAVAKVQAAAARVLSDHQRPLRGWSSDTLPDHAGSTVPPSDLGQPFDLRDKAENHIPNKVSFLK